MTVIKLSPESQEAQLFVNALNRTALYSDKYTGNDGATFSFDAIAEGLEDQKFHNNGDVSICVWHVDAKKKGDWTRLQFSPIALTQLKSSII